MCRFENKKFDACGHYGIEIHDYCAEAVWKAGLLGKLQICIPKLLERSLEWAGPDHLEPPNPTLFIGYEGFCEMCVDKYGLPRSIPEESHSDHKLDYWKQLDAFDPDSLAPYLLNRGFFDRIPGFLGISDQFEAAHMYQGPYLLIPKQVEQLTWSQLRLRMPFTVNGMIQEGTFLSMDEVLGSLGITGGVTIYDSDCIFNAIWTDANLQRLYKKSFKPRGMPLKYFHMNVKRLHASAMQMKTKTAGDHQDSEAVDTLLAESPTLARKSLVRRPQLHPEPGDMEAWRAFRVGNQAKASKLALSAIGVQSPQEGEPSTEKKVPETKVRDSTTVSVSPFDTSTASARAVDASGQELSSVHVSNTNMSMGEEPGYRQRKRSSKESLARRLSLVKLFNKKDVCANRPQKGRRRGQWRHLKGHDTLDDIGGATRSTSTSKATSATPPPKPSAAKLTNENISALTTTDEAEQFHMTAEVDQNTELLHQRRSASTGFGHDSIGRYSHEGKSSASAQPDSGEKNPGGTSASRATNSKLIGTSMGERARKMGGSPASGTQSQHHIPYVRDPGRASRAMEILNRTRMGATPDGTGSPQGSPQPLANSSASPYPFAQFSGRGFQQHYWAQQPHSGPCFQGALQASGVPQAYEIQQQPSAFPDAYALQQPEHPGTIQPQHYFNHSTRQTLSTEADGGLAQLAAPHPFFRSSASPSPPAFPFPAFGDSHELADGLPRLSQDLIPQSSKLAFPAFGDSHELADGLPRLSQDLIPQSSKPAFPAALGSNKVKTASSQRTKSPSQSSRSVQHPQGLGSRAEPQPPASAPETIHIPDSPVSEDDDLQEVSPVAWQKAWTTRQPGAFF